MSIGGIAFPIVNDSNGHPTLFVNLVIANPNDPAKEGTIRAIIETGSDFTFINRATVELMGLRKLNFDVGQGWVIEDSHGRLQEDEFYLATVRIDGVFEDTIIVGMRDSQSALGMDIINKIHLLINAPLGTFELASAEDYELGNDTVN